MKYACAVLSSVAYLVVQFFLEKKKKKFITKKMCVLIFSTTFAEKFLILRRKERSMSTNVYRSSCEVPLFDFNQN